MTSSSGWTRWLALSFVAGLALSVFDGCGPSTKCNASNCTGCCDSLGKCQSGSSTIACGSKGAACVACALGGTCGFGGTCSGGTGAGTSGGGLVSGGGVSNGGGVFGGGVVGGGVFGGGVVGGGTAGGSTACSPLNCTGCCQNGNCVGGASPSACGRSGNVCAVCGFGQSCDTNGFCRGGTGGGTAGGSPACTTCFAPSGGQLVCVPQGTNLQLTTCGNNGNSCVNCAAAGFSACVNGSCSGAGGGPVGGGQPSSGIGAPCTSSPPCQATLGPSAFCKTRTAPHPGFSPATFPSGFCTISCTADGQANCGPGNVCAGGESSWPVAYNETERYCVNGCTSTTNCSSGFECFGVQSGSAASVSLGCWMDRRGPNAIFSGGGYPNKLGAACANNAACALPPDPALALCVGGSDFPATGFPQGMCMTSTSFAPLSYCQNAGGMEVFLPTQADGGFQRWCGQACTQLGSTPRAGYRCVPTYYTDGGTKGGMVWPEICATDSDCMGATATACNTQYGLCCTSSTAAPAFQSCSGIVGP